jgi:regulatory protein
MEQNAPDVIQRLEADPRDPDRVVVTIGPESGAALGARTLLLHIAVVAEEGLRTGLPCPLDLVARLTDREEFQRHYERALNFLAVRPRSEAEVRRKLRTKAVPPESIDAVVARLRRARYLDDAEFARYWIGERARSSPRGARLLRGELRMKGVSPSIIDQALADFEETAAAEAAAAPASAPPGDASTEEPEDRVTREALTLATRKLRSYTGLDPVTFRRRMSGFLLRRGYDYAVVARVLKRLDARESDMAAEDTDPELGA